METDNQMLVRIGTDASKWADEFLKYNHGDRNNMIGWFANAIMAGKDSLKANPTPTARQEALQWLQETTDDWDMETCSQFDYDAVNTIRATLTEPGVPVIPGLREALKNVNYDKPDVTDYLDIREFFIADEQFRKAHSLVVKAARWVADNQPGDE